MSGLDPIPVRPIPRTRHAIQLTRDNLGAICEWLGGRNNATHHGAEGISLWNEYAELIGEVPVGHWIVISDIDGDPYRHVAYLTPEEFTRDWYSLEDEDTDE